MKKLYFLPILLLPFIGMSQSSINLNGFSDVLSGGTHEVITSNADPVDVSFDVNNMGATSTWRITRLKLNVPNGWTDNLCWGHSTDQFGGTCYSSGQMNGNPWTTTV